jgi:hypothetical protein
MIIWHNVSGYQNIYILKILIHFGRINSGDKNTALVGSPDMDTKKHLQQSENLLKVFFT